MSIITEELAEEMFPDTNSNNDTLAATSTSGTNGSVASATCDNINNVVLTEGNNLETRDLETSHAVAQSGSTPKPDQRNRQKRRTRQGEQLDYSLLAGGNGKSRRLRSHRT